MPAGVTYTPITTTTVSGSSTSTITFSNIPATYTDLVLVVSGTAAGDIQFRLNNDSGSNYSVLRFAGTGSGTQTDRFTSTEWYLSQGGFTDALAQAHIQNYANTSVFKTGIMRISNTSSANPRLSLNIGNYRSTSAISRLDMISPSGAYTAGFTASLYGIAAA